MTRIGLVEYIRSHGFKAELQNGELWARSEYSYRLPDDSVQFGSRWERVDVSLSAVRNWLGY